MPDRYSKWGDGSAVGVGTGSKVDPAAARTYIARWLASRHRQLSSNMGGSDPRSVQSEYARQMGNMYGTEIVSDLSELPASTRDELLRNPTTAGISVKGPSISPQVYVSPNQLGVRGPQQTLVHELSHSLGNDSMEWMSKPQEKAIHRLMRARYENGVSPMRSSFGSVDESYADSPSEIYSRLMELRQMNGLDPKKTYTADDVKELRKSGKDADILNRYTDDVILELLNNIASNIPVDSSRSNA